MEISDSLYVRLSGAGLGLIAGDGKFGFETTGGSVLLELGPLANVQIGSVTVQYTNSATAIAEDQETLQVGGITYDFSGAIAANTIAFGIEDFQADVLDFVSLRGNLGLSKVGTAITAVGSGLSATLEVSGSVYVKIENAAFGLVSDADGFGHRSGWIELYLRRGNQRRHCRLRGDRL